MHFTEHARNLVDYFKTHDPEVILAWCRLASQEDTNILNHGVTQSGKTPLFLAAISGWTKVFEAMILLGAKPDRESRGLASPTALLIAAVLGESLEITRLTLEQIQRINPTLINQEYCIDKACTKKGDPVLVALLKYGSSTEAITPIFNMLTRAGASLDAQDPTTGVTARQMAIEKGLAPS